MKVVLTILVSLLFSASAMAAKSSDGVPKPTDCVKGIIELGYDNRTSEAVPGAPAWMRVDRTKFDRNTEGGKSIPSGVAIVDLSDPAHPRIFVTFDPIVADFTNLAKGLVGALKLASSYEWRPIIPLSADDWGVFTEADVLPLFVHLLSALDGWRMQLSSRAFLVKLKNESDRALVQEIDNETFRGFESRLLPKPNAKAEAPAAPTGLAAASDLMALLHPDELSEAVKDVEIVPLILNGAGGFNLKTALSIKKEDEQHLREGIASYHNILAGQQTRGFESVKTSFKERLRNHKFTHFEFKLSAVEISSQGNQVNKGFLKETLFVLPTNDGESLRAAAILNALKAPHVHLSGQGWGATLEKELFPDSFDPAIKRIVTFEMPHPETEETLRAKGLQVICIDHHTYANVDRNNEKSSLEQLMEMIGWQPSRTDMAIAANDRGFIPGLQKLGLSPEEIREIRIYDQVAQGKEADRMDRELQFVRSKMHLIPKVNNVFIVQREEMDFGILRQELALANPNQVTNVLILSTEKISFTGDPRIVEFLMNLDYARWGFKPDKISKYSGGDESGSRFFGFKPSNSNSRIFAEKISAQVMEELKFLVLQHALTLQ